MAHSFKNIRDAIAAGYVTHRNFLIENDRFEVRSVRRDLGDQTPFLSVFPKGPTSLDDWDTADKLREQIPRYPVSVHFSEETNMMGGLGAYSDMYSPETVERVKGLLSP